MILSVCIVPVCPIRAEASHKSEQVSQLLFGDLCEVIERATDFVKIKVVYDNYEGWCQENQLDKLDGDERLLKRGKLAGDWVNEITLDETVMHIPFGSTIPDSGFVGRHRVEYKGKVIGVEKKNLSNEFLKKIAFYFLNTPYLWGGRSVFGIDCSGFTQSVFKFLDIPLLRDASQQVTQGDEVGFLQEAKWGDLAFFDNEAGRITHVGILLNTNTIIHASGKVRIDAIDSMGIINGDTGKRTHKLRLIKRILKQQDSLLF
jgi:hypothetical protein